MDWVKLIPSDGASRAYGAGAVDSAGYIEEEFLVGGNATVTLEGVVLRADAPYTTRILVRRPSPGGPQPSGTVHIEPLHQLADAQITWMAIHTHIVRRGDAWIGVSVHSGHRPGGGMTFLREQDPERYGALELVTPDDSTLPPPGQGHDILLRDLRKGMAHGSAVMADVGALLKSSDAATVLGDFPVDCVIASGWSGTGMFWQEYIDDRHVSARLPDGRPIFDAYFPAIHREPKTRPDVPVAVLFSEGEVWGMAAAGVATSKTDEPRFRIYEVTGTAHSCWSVPGSRPVVDQGDPTEHDGPHNGRSYHRLVNGLFALLEDCARNGTPMPAAPRIDRDPSSPDGIARDRHGNALGGLRNPWVDVPSATYVPRCRCTQVMGYSPLVGAYQPFAADVMTDLYGSDGAHVEQWNARVDEMVVDGWFLPEDANALRGHPE